jgi:hypothetical protein
VSQEYFQGDVSLNALFSYIFGLKESELALLLQKYEEQGGEGEPESLYTFLSLHGRAYVVLWCVLAVVEDINLVMGAVVGPDKTVVWHGVGLCFCRRENAALKNWQRVLEMAAGEFSEAPPDVSESDYWSASHLARQCKDSWQGSISHLFAEAESFYGRKFKEKKSLMEEPRLTSQVGEWLGKWLREMIGKNLPLRAFRLAPVSLPELRELAVRLYPLQSALDGYVRNTLHPEQRKGAFPENSSEKGNRSRDEASPEEVLLLPREEILPGELVVDPVEGIPLGELRPGNKVILKDSEGGEVPGEVYVVRQLKSKEYEIHGKNREKGTFFRYLASGDVKVRLCPEIAEEESPPWWRENWKLLSLFLGAVLLFLFLLLQGRS